MSKRPLLVLTVVAMTLCACPPEDKRAPAREGASSAACASVGQQCEFAPGKLGTCVRNDDCKLDAGCFQCQSQH